MKILWLTAYFEPEHESGSHLEQDLVEAFIENGFTIHVITPRPTRGLTDDQYRMYKDIRHEEKFDQKLIIDRIPMFREKSNTILRAFRYLLCQYWQYRMAIKDEKADVVFCASTPPTQGMMSALVAKRLSNKMRKKMSLVLSLQDIFPDSLVNAGMTSKGSLIWKIGRRVEDYTYENSDKIITISDGFKQNIKSKGVPEGKVAVIPNWIDTSVVSPISRSSNRLISRYNLEPDKFYFTYCGNIGISQNFELLLEAASILKDNDDIRFVIIGDGVYKPNLEKMITEKEIKNIRVLPFQPYEDIADVFSLGDVGLIISKPDISGSSVPSKALSIMAAGRPILASFDCDSELVRLIEENQCGIGSDPKSIDDFVGLCLKMSRDRNVVNTMGKNGRQLIIGMFSADVLTKKYIAVFEEV